MLWCRETLFYDPGDPRLPTLERPELEEALEKREAIQGGYEWVFEPFAPGPDLFVWYYQSEFPRDAPDMKVFARLLGEKEGADLGVFREIMLAWYGIAPQGEQARVFAENQVWFEPVDGKAEGDLTEREAAVIAAIDEVREAGSK